MSATLRAAPAIRHPWLEVFVRDPTAAFGDLLAGYADIHPYGRADAPEAAFMLFSALAADDVARLALGPAVLAWLRERRRAPLPGDRPGRQRAIREIGEAFDITVALELLGTAATLRREFVRWNEWVGPLVLSPARDARAAYWRMLAQMQPLLPTARPNLAPFWRNICREAGNALPRAYLQLGLLGLRRLPDPGTRKDSAWVAGLAHWALANEPTDAEFRAEWMALKPRYPAQPSVWREMVRDVLSTKPFRDGDGTVDPPGWWRVDPDFGSMLRSEIKQPPPRHAPTRVEAENLRKRFGVPLVQFEAELTTLMNRHRRFRDLTGESDYFCGAAYLLGQGLLDETGDDPPNRARIAEELAREGLEWEPSRRALLALWREALTALGALEAAELVGWDRVRRAPDDPTARTQLATLLAEQCGRPLEAEWLLAETIARFPDNAPARSQLAELLIAQDRLAEAAAALDQAVADGAAHEAVFSARARLFAHQGDLGAAREAVAQGLVLDPGSTALMRHRGHLDAGRAPRLQRRAATAAHWPRTAVEPPDSAMLDAAMRHGRLRRLRFWLDRGDAAIQAKAKADLDQLLAVDQSDVYANLIASRYQIIPAPLDDLSNFAISFERALSAENKQALIELVGTHPRLEALILVARAALGDSVAAAEVARWVEQAPGKERAPAAIVQLRASLKPRLAIIRAGGAAARDALLPMVRETNEAMIGDPIAQAA